MPSLKPLALLAIVLVATLLVALPGKAQSSTNAVYLPLVTNNPSAPTLTPTLVPGTTDEWAMRHEVMRLVNDYRVANGCPAATEDTALMAGAQAWSEYMDTNDYYQHSSTVDVYWYDHYGYPKLKHGAAENVAMGQINAQSVFEAWQNSPNHNRTMVDCYRYLNPQPGFSAAYDIGVGLRNWRWTLALSEYTVQKE